MQGRNQQCSCAYSLLHLSARSHRESTGTGSQGGCRLPNSVRVQSQVGYGLEQPGIMGGVPAHGRWQPLRCIPTPFHSMIPWLYQCNSYNSMKGNTDEWLGIKSFLHLCWKLSLYTRKIWNTSLHTHEFRLIQLKKFIYKDEQSFSHTL